MNSKPAVFLLAALLGSTARLAGADSSGAATEPAVELPKFIVTDTRELPPPESWHYGTIPGFEIISNASESATKRLIRDFEIFRLGLRQAWPVPEKPGFPVTLIICGRGNKFQAFVPQNTSGGPLMSRASVFLKRGDHTAIVVDYQSKTIDLADADGVGDPNVSAGPGSIAIEHEKELYRGYIHYLLSRDPATPPWFEEGLTQIIMRMKVDRDHIEFGAIDDGNTVSDDAANTAALASLDQLSNPQGTLVAGTTTPASVQAAPGAPTGDNDFNIALRGKPLLKMSEVFAVTRDDPAALNPLGDNIWSKQCYAFVHMCLYGRGGRYRKPFAQFLSRSAREPVTEQLFKECFRFPSGKGSKEMSYSEMLDELRGYIKFTDYKVQEGNAKLQFPEPIALRDATLAEVGRIKGETMVLAGNDEPAKTELIAPYIRGEKDPNLLAVLGLYEMNHGEKARATKFLEAAATGKTNRPDALVELARARYDAAVATLPNEQAKFSNAQVGAIVDVLVAARKLSPQLPATYELLADTWLHREEKIKTEEVTALVDGLRQFPGRMRLAYQIGALALDANLTDLARAMIDHGLKYSPNDAGRARFEQLRAALPGGK